MKILVSWSSGKDSAWTLHLLNQQHPGAVGGLLTTMNEALDRVAMHGVRASVLEAQAHAAGLPLQVVPTFPHPCPNEVYESRMSAAVARRRVTDGFTHVAFGDLFLEDVRRYREDRLAGTGLTPLFPVWGIPTRQLAEAMIDGGLRARLSCVDPRAARSALAGREFDRSLLRRPAGGRRPVRRERRVPFVRLCGADVHARRSSWRHGVRPTASSRSRGAT